MTSGILQGAHDIVLNAPQFNDNSSYMTITQSFNNLVDKKKGVVELYPFYNILPITDI